MKKRFPKFTELTLLLAAVILCSYSCGEPIYNLNDVIAQNSRSRILTNKIAEIEIILTKPIAITMGPPGETGPYTWGFYQFPKIWRGEKDILFLSVNVGADSQAGEHKPTENFISTDTGRTWKKIDEGDLGSKRWSITLPDGAQLSFEPTWAWSFNKTGLKEPVRFNAAELGLKPIVGPVPGGYKVNWYEYYRLCDLPKELQRFPFSYRDSAGSEWRQEWAAVEIPDLLLTTHVRAEWGGWEDGKVPKSSVDMPPLIGVESPEKKEHIVVLPGGTILWTLATANPIGRKDKQLPSRVLCLESRDHGKTWTVRGAVADDLDAKRGYAGWYSSAEQSLVIMPNGDLLCVMRTRMSADMNDSHHLAVSRSRDKGFNWTKPAAMSECCVTPHLIPLKDDLVALVYGRPGVHVRASGDSGLTWTESVPVVGPPEKHLMKYPLAQRWKVNNDFSCANTTLVVTGPDRFLLAYSDFQHQDKRGKIRKAVKVREIIIKKICK